MQNEHRKLLDDVFRSARQQKEALIEGFLTTLAAQLRRIFYNAATDVLDALEKPGNWQREGLHPRSVGRLKALVEQVNRLNFFGDRDMERMMAQVSDHLEHSPKERSTTRFSKCYSASRLRHVPRCWTWEPTYTLKSAQTKVRHN